MKGEQGLPYVQYYSPQTYNAHPQNWAIVQDQNGVLYFGNGSGILEYDGSQWQLIKENLGGAVRSLAIDEKDGTIYVGGQGKMGYLASDTSGHLRFRSLANAISNEKDRKFGDVWKTYTTLEGTYFLTRQKLFRWDGQAMKVWHLKQPLRPQYGYYVNRKLYLLQDKVGLLTLENERLQKIAGSEIFANDRIYTILPFSKKRLLIGSLKNGLFIYKNNQFTPFQTSIDDFLQENQLYHGSKLNSDLYALTTLRGGIAIIDEKGRLQDKIYEHNKLPNQQASYVFTDQQNGLWLALDKGIARIERSTPLHTYPKSLDIGSINDMVRHEGRLHLATSQGIYYLQPNEEANSFKTAKIQAISGFFTECNALYSTDNQLIAATSGGVYRIQNENPVLIREGAANCLYASSPRVLYVGLQNGLSKLEKKQEQWETTVELLPNINQEIHSIASNEADILWLCTKYSGIIRYHISSSKVEKFESFEGLPMNDTKVFHSPQGLLFTNQDKLLFFDEVKQQFSIFKAFGEQFIKETQQPSVLASDKQGRIFIHSKKETGMMVPKPDAGYEWQLFPLNRLSPSKIHCIYPEKNVVWFGGDDGLSRYQNPIQSSPLSKYITLIRKVSVSNGSDVLNKEIYCNHKNCNCSNVGHNNFEHPEFKFNHNSIQFNYTALSYDKEQANQYQYWLDGFNSEWSEWSTDQKQKFTNLPPGEYHFRVKAKNIYGIESEKGVYSFSIIAPWYHTYWAYLVYALLGLLLILLLIKWRTYRLERQRTELSEKVKERTAELNKSLEELKATQDQLIVQQKLASLGELITGIAHEIQNPLNFINNFAKLSVELVEELREDVDTQKDRLEAKKSENIYEVIDEMEENVQKITEHGERVDSIIKNMLRHARADSGGKAPTNINNLLKEYLNLAYHGFRAKDKHFVANIQLELDESIGEVNIIAQTIGQAFLNIINNALYAIHEKQQKTPPSFNYTPTLWIRSHNLDNERVMITIRDNGTGISEKVKQQVFNPFFTTKPTGIGTGLGLSLTYDIIVQAHQGNLDVSSQKNLFTEFEIILPKK